MRFGIGVVVGGIRVGVSDQGYWFFDFVGRARGFLIASFVPFGIGCLVLLFLLLGGLFAYLCL